MNIEPTKDIPGAKVELSEDVMQELTILNPKWKRYVPFFGGHPISVTKKDETQIFKELNKKRQSPYLICEKTDGVRYLMIITNEQQYMVSREGAKNLVAYQTDCQIARDWRVNPNGEFRQIMHIIDGEMIYDKSRSGEEKLRYLIFDALVVFNKKIIDLPLRDRLVWVDKFMKCNEFLLGQLPTEHYPHRAIEVKIKDFFRLTCSSFVSSQVMQKRGLRYQPTAIEFLEKFYIGALPHENDGLIFNHEEKPYILGPNNGYLKWKPAEYNTVDFLVIPNTKLEGKFSRRILDLYSGWRDTESDGIAVYRMMFYNFTIVNEEEFHRIQEQFNEKYEATIQVNPDLVSEDNFGIIAECKYEKVEPGSEKALLFRDLLSSAKSPGDIHECIMRQQNEEKELAVIKKIQGEPCTKFWEIFRIRTDKNMPNNHEVVVKIEQSIKDDIKFETLVKKNQELNDLVKVP